MTCDPQFKYSKAPQEYECLTFVKDILYNPELIPAAVKLLLVILDFVKRPNWILRQTHLIHMSNLKPSVYRNAMKNLEKSGYLIRMRPRIEGKLRAYEYQVSSFPIFKKDIDNPENLDPLFYCRNSTVEKHTYTFSTKDNVLVETTNPEAKKKKPDILVSSFLDEIKQLKESNLSKSQRGTIAKKYTKEQVEKALKAINLQEYESHFAILVKAIENNYEPKPPSLEDRKAIQKEKISKTVEENKKIAKELHKKHSESLPFSRAFRVSDTLIEIKNDGKIETYPLKDHQCIEALKSHIRKQL